MPFLKKATSSTSSATIGIAAKHWLAVDKLRHNRDAAAYSRAERDRLPQATHRVGAGTPINHVVLGLIFLKSISDTFDRTLDNLRDPHRSGLPELLIGELSVNESNAVAS